MLVCLVLLPAHALSSGNAGNDARGLAATYRHAFVVGNGNYQVGTSLRNSQNDARAVYSKLMQLGFSDSILLTDATLRSMRSKLDEFSRHLRPGSDAVFFYAGHGMMVDGTNYLIPVDANLASENDIKYEALALDDILDVMEKAHARVRLIILDSCRDNPFARRWSRNSRSRNTRGWGAMQATGRNSASGVKIMYATQPGQTASDGTGVNGVFTAALLQRMAMPGVSINDMFEYVAQDVINSTGGSQVPWQEGLLLGAFYFKPSQGGVAIPSYKGNDASAGANPAADEILAHSPQIDAYYALKDRAVTAATGGGRFRIYNDSYIIDTKLSLLWSRCTYGQTYRDGQCLGQPAVMGFNKAMQVAEELNTKHGDGVSTWRLPTSEELSSLHSNKSVPPDIDENYFPNTVTSLHLSSTTYSMDKLVLIQFGYGSSVEHIKPIDFKAVLRLVTPFKILN